MSPYSLSCIIPSLVADDGHAPGGSGKFSYSCYWADLLPGDLGRGQLPFLGGSGPWGGSGLPGSSVWGLGWSGPVKLIAGPFYACCLQLLLPAYESGSGLDGLGLDFWTRRCLLKLIAVRALQLIAIQGFV